ncbi:hypothetical protein [Sporichthya sp.]|uniref:hypothetical protein n=1 Tax=Sporichthya sp. TaxID=65475 RepID=UPI0017B8221E|nr:hypothetical protein [Sporichthya sp.]MBA3745616.1 hypothetical protein [Sporichthya sp.]
MPNLTPHATRAAVTRLRDACESLGRELCHARALTYLQAPGYGDALVAANGRDPERLAAIRSHAQLTGHQTIADNVFHRSELAEPARAVPDEWMQSSCAIGSVADGVEKLAAYRDAGADEIVTYGSTPQQNAGLAAAWSAPAGSRV